jgi:hypothetical protein
MWRKDEFVNCVFFIWSTTFDTHNYGGSQGVTFKVQDFTQCRGIWEMEREAKNGKKEHT